MFPYFYRRTTLFHLQPVVEEYHSQGVLYRSSDSGSHKDISVLIPSSFQLKICYILIGKIKRSIVKFVRLKKTVTEMSTGCLRTMKSFHICIKLSRGEFCVANFIPSCEWCESGQFFCVQNLGQVLLGGMWIFSFNEICYLPTRFARRGIKCFWDLRHSRCL